MTIFSQQTKGRKDRPKSACFFVFIFEEHHVGEQGWFLQENRDSQHPTLRQTKSSKIVHGTESQRTPKLLARAIRYPGLRVRSMGPVGDFLETKSCLISHCDFSAYCT